MKKIRNVQITDKQDASIQHGESLLKYWVLAFVAIAWFTRSEEPTKPVTLYRTVAYVTHDTPGQDSSTLNLVGDWIHSIVRDGDDD